MPHTVAAVPWNTLSLGCSYPLPPTHPNILARVGTDELGVLEAPLFEFCNKHIIEGFRFSSKQESDDLQPRDVVCHGILEAKYYMAAFWPQIELLRDVLGFEQSMALSLSTSFLLREANLAPVHISPLSAGLPQGHTLAEDQIHSFPCLSGMDWYSSNSVFLFGNSIT